MLKLYFDQDQYIQLRDRFFATVKQPSSFSVNSREELAEFFLTTYQLVFRWTKYIEEQRYPKLGSLSTVLEFNSEEDYLIFCLQDTHNLTTIIEQVGYFKIEDNIAN
jgi:hypothetical protein